MIGASAEPRLTITLVHDGEGAVRQAEIASTRPVHLSRLLEGRDPEEVMNLLPMLFTLCGHAHLVAARHALEQAGGGEAAPCQQRLRTLLVSVENLREHLLRIFMQWPGEIGETVDSPLPAHIHTQTKKLLDALSKMECGNPPPDLRELEPALDDLAALVEKKVLGVSLASFRAWDPPALKAWMRRGETLPARFLQRLLVSDNGLADEPGELPPLDDFVLGTIRPRLLSDDWHRFLQHPEGQHGCLATGPLPRQQEHPLLQQCPAQGNWVLARHFLARMLELATTLEESRALLRGERERIDETIRCLNGVVAVETSRGVLVHLAELMDGRVATYRILAPTEWNFHPRGAAWRLLTRIRASGTEKMEQLARKTVLAIDPCVGFDLHLRRTDSLEVTAGHA